MFEIELKITHELYRIEKFETNSNVFQRIVSINYIIFERIINFMIKKRRPVAEYAKRY